MRPVRTRSRRHCAWAAHYLRTKQPQKSLTLARKYQTAHATNPELLDMLGQSQMATGDNTGALETYSKLVNVTPKSPQAQMRLAAVHEQMKNERGAADSLKRAAELQPGFVPARAAQIQMAIRQGKVDEALAIARELQKEQSEIGRRLPVRRRHPGEPEEIRAGGACPSSARRSWPTAARC